MLGSEYIKVALNQENITSLLDEYMGFPALFSALVIPQDFSDNDSINFYMVSPYNAATEIPIYTYSASCRSNSYEKSREIAVAIMDNVNRKTYTDFFITVSILNTIPPMDDTDNYNTPVDIILKIR